MSIKWCGTALRISGVGFAVPMSSPRYTTAESMLMISSGTRCASSRASSVLPQAVGPVRHTYSKRRASLTRSLPAQEQTVEILERDGRPCRPAVVARFAAFRAFHLAQQRVHLLDAQPAIRANGTVTRHRGEQLVRERLYASHALAVREVAQEVAHQRHGVLAFQQQWHRSHRDLLRPAANDVEPDGLELPAELLDEIGFSSRDFKADRHQQRTRLQALRCQP